MEPFDVVGVLATLDNLADLGFVLEMIPIADSGEVVKDQPPATSEVIH